MVQYITNGEDAGKAHQIILGYWGIRGLAQPIRYLLVCAGVPFHEVRYGVHEDGTLMTRQEEEVDWQTVKSKLEEDDEIAFPNLPYLIDKTNNAGKTVKLTQSNAILQYLARRYGFYGSSGGKDQDTEQTEIDVLQEEAYDFRNVIVETAYTLEPAAYTVAFDKFTTHTLPKYLNRFEKYLSNRTRDKNKRCFWFVGNQLSLVDFILYELLWQMTQMVPGSIVPDGNTPNIWSFLQAFQNIPEIDAYMKSSKHYIQHPINSPWASYC